MREIFCGEAPEWLVNAFKSYDIKLTEIGREDALPSLTAHHIDLMRVRICNKWFTKENIEETLGEKYPKDVPLNVAQVGNYLICNPKTCSKNIIEHVKDKLETIPVNQGYTKCSTLVLNNHAIITEDESIATAVSGKLDCLLIDKGYVKLPGYNYGFIGGASCVIEDKIFFFGCVQNHPSYDKILKFADKQNMNIISLSDTEQLLDIGGVVNEL